MPTYKNARACLAEIAARYRMLDGYSDEGFVHPYGSTGPKKCWFETQFSRPGLFRFHFDTPHPYPPLRHRVTRTVIGSDGTTPYFSIAYPGEAATTDIEASLALAIAGATGISHGAAHTIGNLLLEDVGGFSLSMLNRPRFRRSRQFAGEHCGRITGIHPRGGRVTVWFGTKDLLLRKIVKHTFRREEVRMNIRIAQPLDPAAFRVPGTYEHVDRTARGRNAFLMEFARSGLSS